MVFLIDYWFLNNATKMNPNYNFGQAFPGVNDGCGSGLVEIDAALVDILDSIALVTAPYPCAASGVPCPSRARWTDAHDAGMVAWVRQWDAWLRASPFSTWACNYHNNHNAACRAMWLAVSVGWTRNDTMIDLLIAGSKETSWTNTTLPNGTHTSMPYQQLGAPDCPGCDGDCTGTCAQAPIGGQILPSGFLPFEANRVNSIGYTGGELHNLFHLAQISRHAAYIRSRLARRTESHRGVATAAAVSTPPVAEASTPASDLFEYVSLSGSSIRGALDFLIPFATGKEKWPHPTESNNFHLFDVLRHAAHVWNNATYMHIAASLNATCEHGCGVDPSVLWWPE
eukprot:m.882591 g.882591  ORF g.882591 m.882591 type:complete len:341 (+) comp23597_c0_seq46:1536-2558(+)